MYGQQNVHSYNRLSNTDLIAGIGPKMKEIDEHWLLCVGRLRFYTAVCSFVFSDDISASVTKPDMKCLKMSPETHLF